MRRFTFRLALALGMTRSELMENIDSQELSEWIAFDRIEPIPQPWFQSGLQCATMANVWGAKATPEDFMPVEKPKKGLSKKHALAVFQSAVPKGK